MLKLRPLMRQARRQSDAMLREQGGGTRFRKTNLARRRLGDGKGYVLHGVHRKSYIDITC